MRADFRMVFRLRNWNPATVLSVTLVLLAMTFIGSSQAQQIPGLTLDQLQQMRTQQGGVVQDANLPPPNVVLQPERGFASAASPSRLEEILSKRAGVWLPQFGYEQLGGARSVTVPQAGAIQDDYVMGSGDEIVVSLRGMENSEVRTFVDRNGQIILPRLTPVPVAGRTLGSVRQDIDAAVRRAYVATNAFVSIGRVRQISVLVAGEVNNPGQRLVTGLSSVVDALLLSGGVKKTGSLRNVRIERGGRQIVVDLYSILTANGRASAMRLADGDRILVPLLGRTVAVSGLVRQPGIYELPVGQASLPVAGLLQLAGGEEVRGLYRMSILQVEADGRTNLVNISGMTSAVVRDSEILFLQMGANQVTSQATLSGGSGLAGSYAVASQTRLSELLRAPGALGASPYTLFGLIVRRNSSTLMRTLVPFTPAAIVSGREDLVLQGEDVVRIFSETEVRMLNYIMRVYLQRIGNADAALRNPLSETSSDTRDTAAGFTAIQRESEQERRQATVQTYLINVPSEVQRSTITNLLEAVPPGAAPEPTSTQRNVPVPAVPPVSPTTSATGVYASMPGVPLPPQQTPIPQNANQNQNQNQNTELANNFQTSLSNEQSSNREVRNFGQLVRQLESDPLILINFLVDHRARIDGAVRGPGDYLIGPSTSLSDLVQAAGGSVNWADQNSVELITSMMDRESGKGSTVLRKLPLTSTSMNSHLIRPGDQLRFAQISSGSVGSVTIQGEVRNPGTFPMLRGDKLSDILARAGGLTEVAYPLGTVFLRQSAAQMEREGYQRAAREVQDQLVIAMTRAGTSRMDPAAFASLQTFVSEMRQQRALGRISIVADPSVLAARPDLDPLAETGDVIYVPQRPSTISVLGQVLQPGNYPYIPNESISSYISKAGGFASSADDSQTFLVFPDGSARLWERSWFRYGATDIPPGTAIVVPRDVTPLDLRQTIVDLTQILSQLAVSIASVAVISKQ